MIPYTVLDPVGSQHHAIQVTKPDLIVPCDDAAVWQLHENHARHPELRQLIEASIGSAASFPCIRSRVGLMKMARNSGVPTPDTKQIESEADLANLDFSGSKSRVMKLAGTIGGQGVRIVHSHAEAVSAFREFRKKSSQLLRWKRFLLNRDPLAFWQPDHHAEASEISIQEFIVGRPANAMMLCDRGEVLGIVSVEVIASQGSTGASTIVKLIGHAEIATIASQLAKNLSLSGFHGLDFILESQSDKPYLIELNPRATQLGHLNLAGHGDLVGRLCQSRGMNSVLKDESPIESKLVAFFPQALTWSADCPDLKSAYMAIPWNAPKLVRELLREPWPERIWLQKLLHKLRGKPKVLAPKLDKLNPPDTLAMQSLLTRNLSST